VLKKHGHLDKDSDKEYIMETKVIGLELATNLYGPHNQKKYTYTEVFGYGNTRSYFKLKVRITCGEDAHDSAGSIEVFCPNNLRWSLLHDICVSSSQAKVGKEGMRVNDFSGDRDELLRVARNILF